MSHHDTISSPTVLMTAPMLLQTRSQAGSLVAASRDGILQSYQSPPTF